MAATPDPIDRAKFAAAYRAAAFVEDGMRVGLGTGSTAAWMVRRLGERIRDEGLRITGVPTSDRTAELARGCGIPVVALEDAGWLDVTIDGADEADENLDLIKGGGGALLREKIVAAASDLFVVIADSSKRVEALGDFPLPVEVTPFGWQVTQTMVEEALEGQDVDARIVTLRRVRGAPFRTDGGNVILDLALARIGHPHELSGSLLRLPGVVETGLFLDMADILVTGRDDGLVELRDITSGSLTEDRVDIDAADALFGDADGPGA